MRHVLLATVATMGLLAAAPASAQSTSVTTSTTKMETTGSISIAPEKRTVIKQRLSTAKPVTIKEKVTVGATIPTEVELQTVPEAVISDVPAIKGYRYFVWNDDVVLVEPSSRKVVQIIE